MVGVLRATGVAIAILGACGCASHPHAAGAAGTPRTLEASKVADLERSGFVITKKNGERLYCTKSVETGSHMSTTASCLTQAEWDRVHQNTQSAMDALTEHSVSSSPGH
jgi:hypothetical protein